MPDLVQVARKYRDQGASVLLVSYDLQVPKADRVATLEKVRKFVDARGWGLPVHVFDAPTLAAINERFDLPGPIPLTLAFDKEGREVGRLEDAASRDEFERLMLRALGR